MSLFAILTMIIIIIIVAIRVVVIFFHFFSNEFDYKRQIMCRTVVIHIALKGETQQKQDINGTNRTECFCNEPWFRFLLKISIFSFQSLTMGSMTASNHIFQNQSMKSIFQVLCSEQSISMIYAWFGPRRNFLSIANTKSVIDSFHLLSTAFTKWEPCICSCTQNAM